MNDSYMYVEQIQPRGIKILGGLEGIASGNTTYTTRIDTVSTSGITYIGKAIPGSIVSNSVWQIQIIDESQTPETTIILFADGNAEFNNIWDNRTTLNYS